MNARQKPIVIGALGPYDISHPPNLVITARYVVTGISG